MKINIIYPKPKINNNYYKSYKEYIKRLMPYCKINLLEYKKEKEIQNYILHKNTLLISKNNETITTEDFAQIILEHKIKGNLNFLFYNGIENYNMKKLCLSQLEMGPIEITMLLEQIYRSYAILEGKTYHK